MAVFLKNKTEHKKARQKLREVNLRFSLKYYINCFYSKF